MCKFKDEIKYSQKERSKSRKDGGSIHAALRKGTLMSPAGVHAERKVVQHKDAPITCSSTENSLGSICVTTNLTLPKL